MRRPWPTGGLLSHEKKIYKHGFLKYVSTYTTSISRKQNYANSTSFHLLFLPDLGLMNDLRGKNRAF
jgi:hypothetical protein